MKNNLLTSLALFFLFLSACGTATPNITNADTQVITILEYNFIPDTITAAPGEIIFIYNQDPIPHQILSQSADDQFDNTGVFDSFIVEQDSTATITIPSTQASGTTLYFYDDMLKDEMLTPNGSIQVQ